MPDATESAMGAIAEEPVADENCIDPETIPVLQQPVVTKISPAQTANVVRCPSIASSTSSSQEICRICHWEGDSLTDSLVAPCYCAGSLRYVHQRCLQQWIKSSDIRCCELCKFQFVMNTKVKSFSEWESLQMSAVEKRKLICNVLFHCVALTCVLWSLYVLIERTMEELERGALDWPFWTKLVVVAFGVFGVAVFKYIQCKAYVNLCRRWRAYNRVIYIMDAPEKVGVPPDSKTSPAKRDVTILVSPEAPRPANDDAETHALLNV